MPLTEYKFSDFAEPLERICIYGPPKAGKTRLATSLPERFGNIIYYAADPSSERLSSVLPNYRERIHIVKSHPKTMLNGKPDLKWDPDKDAFEFVLNEAEWKKRWPLARTIVWDTMTQTSADILQSIATSGQFSEKKHIIIGEGDYAQAIPMMGDYMATQNRIDRLTDFLFRTSFHIIILCHAIYDETSDGSDVEGGPATCGKAQVRKYAGKFPSYFYVTRGRGKKDKPGDPEIPSFIAYTSKVKIWGAGIRSERKDNPIASFELGPDPIDFWNAHDGFLLRTKETA